MARRDRSNDKRDGPVSGGGGFLGQLGLFETANGLPSGPMAIVLAIAAAVVIYPVMRLLRMVTRR
jgi:hypothetical protein